MTFRGDTEKLNSKENDHGGKKFLNIKYRYSIDRKCKMEIMEERISNCIVLDVRSHKQFANLFFISTGINVINITNFI